MSEVFEFIKTYFWAFLTIAIPVFATIYTAYSRIRNENRETHKPYLNLKNIDKIDVIKKKNYYLILKGRSFSNIHGFNDDFELGDNEAEFFIRLELENIGYGVASNIKFYDLLTTRQIIGDQVLNEDKNQKLFTTFDIASSVSKDVDAVLYSTILNDEGIDIDDHARILCVYQDLNGNIYNFIISINVKNTGHYDFFSYQPSSKSYKKWILENKVNYKRIIREYKNI